MREAYHEQLRALAVLLATMCDQSADALEQATRALLDVDAELAAAVVADDVRIDDARTAAEEQAFTMLALQAPVATDLRSVVSAIHGAGSIERMGGLAVHIAQAAARRYPAAVLPPEVAPYFVDMGRVGVALARKAGEVLRSSNLDMAAQMELDDDEMDELHRRIFSVLIHRDWAHGIEAAVDITLLARFYERFADHTVAIARGVVYVVTGHRPVPVVPQVPRT